MLTVAQQITLACQIAKCPNYTAQALELFNSILSDVCFKSDFALARGLFQFDFNPGLTSNFGSGPYNLPLDYLRASGSSGEGQKTFFWTLQGVPYPMIPCDLSEFDMQVQQAGLQSYPWLWATDLGGPLTDRITLVTNAAVTANVAVALTAANAGLAVGQGVAGEGIVPGTMVTSVATTLATTGNTHTNTTLDNLGSLSGVRVGDGVRDGSSNIPAGTTVAVINSPSSITLSAAATGTTTGDAITFTLQGAIVGLSQPATGTDAMASVFFGIPPVAFAYPPPSGAYPVSIRYQRWMPPIVDTTQVPWFPDEGYTLDALAGRLMQITDDTRVPEFIGDGTRLGRADRRLREYLENANDKKNRPQTVELDRRRFGPAMRVLRSTKTIGW